MKAQGWAALQLSANDPHCWLQPTPYHTYSEACETEPSWDTQIRRGRCDEEPGACYIWELGSMLALFPSPLPVCAWVRHYLIHKVNCSFLCVSMHDHFQSVGTQHHLLRFVQVNVCSPGLLVSFSWKQHDLRSHTYMSADGPRLLICWKCKWSSYKKSCAQQQNISGVSTKDGNFGVLEYTGCHMALFPNHSDLLSHQQEPAFPHILTNIWYHWVSDVTFVGCKKGPFCLPAFFPSQLLVKLRTCSCSPLYISCRFLCSHFYELFAFGITGLNIFT